MKEKVSTLNSNVRIEPLRQSGNTTRQIDEAINIIFSGKICVVRDHYMDGNHRQANGILFDKIIDRLWSEYPRLMNDDKINSDEMKLEISLK